MKKKKKKGNEIKTDNRIPLREIEKFFTDEKNPLEGKSYTYNLKETEKK